MISDNVCVLDYNGKKLGKDEIHEKINAIKSLVLKDEVCKKLRNDDIYLLRFLHASEYNIENAFEKIKRSNAIIKSNPKHYAVRSPKHFEKQLRSHFKVLLDKRDKERRSIYLFRIGDTNMGITSVNDISLIENILFEHMSSNSETILNGICAIIDMKNIPLNTLKYVRPHVIQLYLEKIESFALKNYVAHFINISTIAKTLIKWLLPLLNDNIRKKVKLHTELDTLYEHIDKESLNDEYGGTHDVNYDDLLDKFLLEDEKITNGLRYFDILTKNV